MTLPSTSSLRVALVLAGAGLLLAACGSDPVPTASTGRLAGDGVADVASTVEIVRSRYEPAEIEVAAGTTVDFVNRDASNHTVTSLADAPAAFDSGLLGKDEGFEVTFAAPGTYAYFCEIHPTMRAIVVVE